MTPEELERLLKGTQWQYIYLWPQEINLHMFECFCIKPHKAKEAKQLKERFVRTFG